MRTLLGIVGIVLLIMGHLLIATEIRFTMIPFVYTETTLHGPTNEMDLECPTSMSWDEEAEIKATIRNYGPAATFEFDFYPYDDAFDYNDKICSKRRYLDHDEEVTVACTITAEQISRGTTGVAATAYSSIDDLVISGPRRYSFKGSCGIAVEPERNLRPMLLTGILGFIDGVILTSLYYAWKARRSRQGVAG